MTEQELREKIKNIILEKVIAEPLDASMAIEIADALIDVGIGDVSDIKAESNKYEILYRLQNKDMAIAFVMTNKYKTRAEAAERDLQAWKDCAQKWQKGFTFCVSIAKYGQFVRRNACQTPYFLVRCTCIYFANC